VPRCLAKRLVTGLYHQTVCHSIALTAGEVLGSVFEKHSQPASPLTESNRRPSPYHGDALPTELRGRIFGCLTWGFGPAARRLRSCTPVIQRLT
jgi:hypothetical protein